MCLVVVKSNLPSNLNDCGLGGRATRESYTDTTRGMKRRLFRQLQKEKITNK